MATKRKVRRFNGGGDAQDDVTGVDLAAAVHGDGEWARYENYGDGTTPSERVAQARSKMPEASNEEVGAMGAERIEAEPAATTKQTFKQAFAAARKAGDKTFEWEGKKYSSALASSAGAGRGGQGGPTAAQVASPKPKTEAAPKKKYEYEAPLERVYRENRERDATRKESAHLARMHPAPKPRNLAERSERYRTDLLSKFGMKKGGAVSASSRADGIAKRGKTRGTMR